MSTELRKKASAAKAAGAALHAVVVGTKPDLIKQAPIFRELRERGQHTVLIHTGQHYDARLSGGLEKELGLVPDVRLRTKGLAPHQSFGKIVHELGGLFAELAADDTVVVPWIHGDTFAAHAAGTAAYLHRIASVHVEAGLRTLTPKKALFGLLKDGDIDAWRAMHESPKNFEKGSAEPYPEQWNTRCADAGSGVFLAPCALNARFLRDEGFPKERVAVTGNTVVDALRQAAPRASSSQIFHRFPALANGFLRVCVHRRENTADRQRFCAIVDAVQQLLEDGETLLWISLPGTDAAIARFGLNKKIEQLSARHGARFVFSPVWPEYADVLAAMRRCRLCITDSGSMPEEMNELGVPCVTLRYGSDRAESLFVGGNVLAPPMGAAAVHAVCRHAIAAPPTPRRRAYGRQPARRCIGAALTMLGNRGAFLVEEERVGG